MASYSQTNGDAEANRPADTIGAGSLTGENKNRSTQRKERDELTSDVSRDFDQASQEAKKNYEVVKQRASEYADRGEAMLREQVEHAPMQTIAIAVGIGFIAGLLLRR